MCLSNWDASYAKSSGINEVKLNENIKLNIKNKNSLASCPIITSSDFRTLAFDHKIRVTFTGPYTVDSWDTDNPQTTQLDYDGGDWAYYHNNGYGYLEIELTISSGGVNCTYDFTIYY